MASPDEPLLRPSGRVILLDLEDRILLFTVDQRDAETGKPFWFTPGGGVEAGESPEETARRELFEETGLSDVPLGPCVWVHEHTWTWNGRAIRSIDYYHLCRTEVVDVSAAFRTDLEQEGGLAHRWWTLAEMMVTTDLFAPRHLVSLLGPLLAGDVPPTPLRFGVSPHG